MHEIETNLGARPGLQKEPGFVKFCRGALGWLGSLLTPILAGLLAAFVLSVPMNGFEKLLRRWLPKAKQALLDGLKDGLKELQHI